MASEEVAHTLVSRPAAQLLQKVAAFVVVERDAVSSALQP
jgi:hypothetical protein